MRGFRLFGRGVPAGALLATAFGTAGTVSPTSAAGVPTAALPQSVPPTLCQVVGSHPAAAPLTVTVALQPNHAGLLTGLLASLYNPASAQYHHWLARGQFDAIFAPGTAQIAQVTGYLQSEGLRLLATPSPFLVRVTGTSAQVEGASGTHVADYISATRDAFYANDAAIRVPAALSGIVAGVAGLSNTVRLHPE